MIFLKSNNLFQIFIQYLINIFFRLNISIKKKIGIYSKNNTFLSGDFFETLADTNKNPKIIFTSLKNFPKKKDYEKLKKKTWIFHNSDEIFDLKKKKSLDFFKPQKCFSQNLIITKKNYNFLPIGLENRKFHNHGDVGDFYKLRKKNIKKISKVLYGFNITNKNRIKVRDCLKSLSICEETKGWNSYFYRRILINYMFVACPEGNGIDTHRMWEALYLRTIPIMEKNKISDFLLKANLPIFVLNKWSDLSKFNENKLRKIYFSKKKLFNNRYLFQNYWKNLIIK